MKRSQRKPRKVPTQSRARATWDAILDGAAEVLLKQGYEKATTDRIADRAGVSIGSVYEYFPNKEAIFAAVMLRWNEQRWKVFTELQREDPGTGLEAAIRATVRARVAATLLDPRLNTALNLEVPHHVTKEQASNLLDEFLAESLSRLAIHASEVRKGDLQLMAELVIHATHAAIDNMASSDAKKLASKDFEDELKLMLHRYLAH
jgi:AcrR family transcriptional regulator